MTRDDLYQAAFEYKRTKLWKKLWDNDIFALRLSDGRIGYINVMGRLGEYMDKNRADRQDLSRMQHRG